MIRRFVKQRSSLLLSLGAGMGVISTAYLAAQAGFRTAHMLESRDPTMELKEKARVVWKLYIPTGISATATIVCLAGVKRVDARRTLAAQTALAVSQRAYESYRAQVIEELGEKKDQKFLAEVASKRIEEKPPTTIVAGSGNVLCCELFTGRYFNSSMEAINKAINEVNAKLLKHDYATLDDLYWLLDLQKTSSSSMTGWESSRLLELEFSTILYEEKPCLAFDYNYVKAF